MNFDWIGKRIREIRKEKGITLRVLQTRSAVSNSHISQIENGKHDGAGLTLRNADAIARALGMTLFELIRPPGESPVLDLTARVQELEFQLNAAIESHPFKNTMVSSHVATGNSLVDRLRGIYETPIRDGGGPINGSMVMSRRFPVGELSYQAADEIERLTAQLAQYKPATEPGAPESPEPDQAGIEPWMHRAAEAILEIDWDHRLDEMCRERNVGPANCMLSLIREAAALIASNRNQQPIRPRAEARKVVKLGEPDQGPQG